MTSTEPSGRSSLRPGFGRPAAAPSWSTVGPGSEGARDRDASASPSSTTTRCCSTASRSWINVNAYDFDLVLTAHTWLQLVHSDNFPTDLVFLDFQLKEPVSIEARVRTCRAAGAKVIVLSSLDTRESRERALDAGAVGVPLEGAADARGDGRRPPGHGRRP